MIAMMSFMTAAPSSAVARRRRGGADATPMLPGSRRQRRKCLKVMPNAVIYGKEKSFIRRELLVIYGASFTLFNRNRQEVHLHHRQQCTIFNHTANKVVGDHRRSLINPS
jgi:hypothetical protein